jgi:hypothetical protein
MQQDTLPLKFDSLKAAIVTARIRPHMKGDTLEYSVESVKMRPNAVVEELLLRLPGLQIAPDGNISYNGEKIEHLLVDGEDIFGDNPTLVTRNFDASKIARVQILDRKSEQARFTGVDDGSRTKTLNLVMKETAKNGYFGRMELGGSTEGYFTTSGALAGFRGQEQFTTLAFAGNTGSTASGGNGKASPEVGFLSNISDPLGASAGTGIPKLCGLATHYSNHWNNPDAHLQANYLFGDLWTNPVSQTQSSQWQTNRVFDQFQQNQSVNQQSQHFLDVIFERALNSKSGLRVELRDFISRGENRFGSATSSRFNDTLTNSGLRTIRDRTTSRSHIGDITWRTQLGRQLGRQFSVSMGVSNIDHTTDGYLNSVSRYFFPPGSVQQIDTTDQRKLLSDGNLMLRGALNYTQPVVAGVVLGLRYGLSISKDQPRQNTYEGANGKYDIPIDSLTSNLSTRTVNQQASINLQGKDRHLTYFLAMSWNDYAFRQQDKISENNVYQKHRFFTPAFLMNYTPGSTFNITVQYGIVTQQPILSQLASIRNNSDPLHLTIGNPGLQPATRQDVSVGFRWLRAWMINMNASLSINNNSISTRIMTDSLGRQISQPVNVNGGGSAGINFSLIHVLAGIDWGLNSVNNFNQTVNYVNNNVSRNDVFTNGGGVSAKRYVTNKYSFLLTTNFTHLYSRSSVNTSVLQYWTQSHSASMSLYILPHYEFGTSSTYTWQAKTSSFSGNTSVFLWNSVVSRKFLMDQLTLKAVVNNILDQNSGVTRSNTGNTNTQTATNIIGRYWMLSVMYHFDNKFKKK